MIGVLQAQALLTAPVTSEERVGLEEAVGRRLAQPVVAARDHPPFDCSAMDGFAIRAEEAAGALEVVGESAAGAPFGYRLGSGQAVRISTGAAMPEGADSVADLEAAQTLGQRLTISEPVRFGAHVRRRAGDFARRETLLAPGRVLGLGDVMLAAAAGVSNIVVRRRPTFAILCNGHELVAPGDAAQAHQVFDSASIGVRLLARDWGADAGATQILPDDRQRITTAAAEALERDDGLVLIGGASVGPHDHAQPALRALGLDVHFSKVAIKPGKPTWFGVANGKPVLGLPGNPASALVCARLFLAPLIERMLGGDGAAALAFGAARLDRDLPATGPREEYLRAQVTQGVATPMPDQDSSLASSLSRSNGLIRRPAHALAIAAGADVETLDWLSAPTSRRDDFRA